MYQGPFYTAYRRFLIRRTVKQAPHYRKISDSEEPCLWPYRFTCIFIIKNSDLSFSLNVYT